MSNVKWIKITTNMFEDEKIDFIESLPEADSILIIWIKLLTLAGKCNAGGFIFLTENIPYTEEMLTHKFRRPLNTVKFALRTLHELGMIELDDQSFIKISNWGKHQNIEGLEKIREQTRKRVAKYREKQNQLPSSNVTGNVTVTGGNATDKELELEEELEIDKDIYKDIIAYLNTKANKNFKHSSKATQRLINARLNEGFALDDFKKVIDTKVSSWEKNPNMNSYLRPQTLFGTKFEGYLNEGVKEKIQDENDYGW
ncbi:MAG: replication protein [Tissierella sp.]|nr:replication protein [Tissierella sp.]